MASIQDFFSDLQQKINDRVPQIIEEAAHKYFTDSFSTKSFDGIAWKETKEPVRTGSLMVRSGELRASVRPTIVSASLVRMSAGSTSVPYAEVHNTGGIISRSSRSENFIRNRVKGGKNKGKFKRGITTGKGFTIKEYSYNMPKRQFMGQSEALNLRIKSLIEGALNDR